MIAKIILSRKQKRITKKLKLKSGIELRHLNQILKSIENEANVRGISFTGEIQIFSNDQMKYRDHIVFGEDRFMNIITIIQKTLKESFKDAPAKDKQILIEAVANEVEPNRSKATPRISTKRRRELNNRVSANRDMRRGEEDEGLTIQI